MNIKIKLLHKSAQLPEYKTSGAAAADICAAIDEPITLAPGGFSLVPTGFAIDPGEGDFAVLLFARSGLATKHGINLANGVGVIDPDYRGEVKVSLTNISDKPYTITPGERIAQMMIVPTIHASFTVTDSISETDRGSGGFGHTGKSN